ncbi:type II toxin-antitoxin system RelE/ParE family toxin [Saccharomonospora halophila]|uniref:type II toxin-antitoxin system RelE/ParE family toxin n=1 Tax=Saccharomonospora halophila TaxID=129922 RepID=UPI00036CE06E|nr:type II toxin-antitoxin system RelE/ParE family toxin [Saccharomonospora halophila]
MSNWSTKVETWFLDLCRTDPDSADRVEEAIEVLEQRGPGLGRPLVDRIKDSSVHNLKELRPASAGGTEIRILFVFDVERCAVLLVAGDKCGRWKQWYSDAIPLAEKRYHRYLTELEVDLDG